MGVQLIAFLFPRQQSSAAVCICFIILKQEVSHWKRRNWYCCAAILQMNGALPRSFKTPSTFFSEKSCKMLQKPCVPVYNNDDEWPLISGGIVCT